MWIKSNPLHVTAIHITGIQRMSGFQCIISGEFAEYKTSEGQISRIGTVFLRRSDLVPSGLKTIYIGDPCSGNTWLPIVKTRPSLNTFDAKYACGLKVIRFMLLPSILQVYKECPAFNVSLAENLLNTRRPMGR